MNRRQIEAGAHELRDRSGKASKGFTLIEMVVVVGIVLVMSAMAIPLVSNVTSYFKMRGAVQSVTGAVQSTRYLAIFQGCPYQVVLTAATSSYQVQNSCPSGVPFANYCTSGVAACPVPLSGSGTPVTLNSDLTLTFSPGGKVTSASFPGGGINLTITYPGKAPELIQVSSYGNIHVTP
jgi:prepilin-type N-terminal cleavage/methylation domain-containing protein